MRKLKSLLVAIMAFAMVMAMSSVALAADTATLKVVVNGEVLAENVAVNVGESVFDAVDNWAKTAGYAIDWTTVTSTIGDKTGKVLKSLDGKGSVPYNSENLDPYEYYDSSVDDQTLARVNAALLAKYPASEGLGLWMGNGVGYSNDGPYMAYVGDDWTFTVNGSRPVDANDPSVELYMNQATIAAGDVIVLNYGETIEVWEY